MKTVNAMGLEVHYREGTSDEAVIEHSFANDIFFPAIPEFRIKSGVVIDIGAHIGTFSLLAADKFKDARVYAFEPNEDSFQILKRNAEVNKLNNMTCLNAAITSHTGVTNLYLDSENWGHSTSFNYGGKEVSVNSIKLSDFFAQKNIQACDLIKFNCEGAEFEILFSLQPEQLKTIGMMLVLFHEDLSTGSSLKSLYHHLALHGFYCRVVNRSEKRGWLIAKNKSYYSRGIPPGTLSGLKILMKEFRTWMQLS